MKLERIPGAEHLATIPASAHLAILRGTEYFTVAVAEPNEAPYLLVLRNGKAERQELTAKTPIAQS